MQIHPYFGNIRTQLIDRLDKAEHSIKVAMAWFTNQVIFQVLLDKAASGIKVELAISDSEANFRPGSHLYFSGLERKGMAVHIIRTIGDRFMHHKFAVIDNEQVLTGSYNWSSSAHTNLENMLVINDHTVANIYSLQYNHLVRSTASVPLHRFLQHIEVSPTTEVQLMDIEMFNLEKEFNSEVDKAMRETEQIGVKLRFNIVYGMIKRYTAVGAATKLSNDDEQSGFLKLIEINRPDLTFEYLTAKTKFARLFDKNTIENAKKKLFPYIGRAIDLI